VVEECPCDHHADNGPKFARHLWLAFDVRLEEEFR
jgi:hypothetical protein